MIKQALDTNVLVYYHETKDEAKQRIAQGLMAKKPIVSAQVVSEYINVAKRKWKANKFELMKQCVETLEKCSIYAVQVSTLKLAESLMRRYDFQIFDSIVVASALEADCNILFSEDMQHNLMVNGRLQIRNPFL
jgi:predicted nucleic acid-binding protein